jgi:hypothetical protein
MTGVDALIRRQEALAAERARQEGTWQEILDHVLPRRAGMREETPGARRGSRVYDSTPNRALVRLAAVLNSMLTNPATRWFALELEDPAMSRRHEVKEWLEKVSARLQRGLEGSNFATEVHEMYLDLGSVGTACVYMEEGKDERDYNFSCRHIREIYAAEDETGRVDTVFRKFTMTARQMVQRWGKDACGTKTAEQAEREPDARREILHCVLPRAEAMPGKAGRENLPFASVWIDLGERRKLDEGGYHEFPYCVPRWVKASGETYGRSPALDALADVKTLSAMARTLLITGEKVANPPLNVPDENTQVLNIPGGVNYYDSRTGAKIEPIHIGANLPLNFEMLREKREAVADAFFMHQLQLVDARRMTAEEVRARVSENLRILGPIFGRLQSEFFQPIVARCYGILSRAGKLPPPPSAIQGAPIRVRYASPVARAQRSGEGEAVALVARTALDWARAVPEVLDNVDFDAAFRILAELDGAPAGVLRSEKARDLRREERARAQEAASRMLLKRESREGGAA